jgi:two-component system response regulator PilR (NtrC family)
MTAPATQRLLVVDDEPDLRTLYELALVREGYAVDTADTVADALARLAEARYAAVVTDMRLPDGSGLELLRWLDAQARSERAVVITAYGSAENAVEALKAGAFDYLTKPVDLRQFRSVVAAALGVAPAPVRKPVAGGAAAEAAVAGAVADAAAPAVRRLVGDSPAMQQVRALVDKVARSMAPVLISGESGTGKELVARAIHALGARAAQPFVAVNCGAIPEALLEAEFFGYRKGAFTGAAEDREGFFQAAHGGSLLLDEIGELPLAMQSKLLRAIQERAVRPVGATAEVPVHVRLLSATHKDLGAEVRAGRFRQDLYYRLNVIQIRVPPLRERLSDLPAICATLLARLADEAQVAPAPTLSAAALQRLADYDYPGNVRELENLLHRAVALAGGDLIDEFDLGLPTGGAGAAADDAAATPQVAAAEAAPAPAALPADLVAHLDAVEREILQRALVQYRYNRTAAGARLGLTLRQMRYRMARLGIDVAEGGGERGAGG